MSRCVAVASHGRRCQQTPYRGSPYCWHHQKSRKLPAPSRVRAARPAPVDEVQVLDRPKAPPAERLVAELGEEGVEEILDFLAADEDGSFLLERKQGVVRSSVELVPRLWVRWRKAV
ncbi:MAG: hypothetical protein ACR2N6_07030 [Miltoncostaeaceae bacterium]